jgi:hypothetical protein
MGGVNIVDSFAVSPSLSGAGAPKDLSSVIHSQLSRRLTADGIPFQFKPFKGEPLRLDELQVASEGNASDLVARLRAGGLDPKDNQIFLAFEQRGAFGVAAAFQVGGTATNPTMKQIAYKALPVDKFATNLVEARSSIFQALGDGLRTAYQQDPANKQVVPLISTEKKGLLDDIPISKDIYIRRPSL